MAKISNIGTFVARALGYSTLILTIPGQGQNPPMSQPQFGPKWTFGDPRVRLLKEATMRNLVQRVNFETTVAYMDLRNFFKASISPCLRRPDPRILGHFADHAGLRPAWSAYVVGVKRMVLVCLCGRR